MKKPKEIYPGLEPIANQFLHGASDAGFKFNEGTPIAHAGAMALSTAVSMKRIADMLELWFNEKNSNSGIAQLRSIATSLKMPPSKELMEVLERIAGANEYAASMMGRDQTVLDPNFFGEGYDGAGKEEFGEDRALSAAMAKQGGAPRRSFFRRFLDNLVSKEHNEL